MPEVQLLPTPRVNPYAYENSKAVMDILNIMGSTEVARRRKFMTQNVLEAIASRKGPAGIASAALMEPGFSGGIPGALQRFASPFAQSFGGVGIEDIIAGRGIESAFETISPSQMMAAERWDKYQQAVDEGDTDTANRLLSSALVNFNVPTSREIWGKPERREVSEVDFADKVELSSAERSTAKKGVEEIFESTPLGAARLMGVHALIKDYEKPTVMGMYKQWLTEQGYGSKTPRQRKSLDEIWDGKMNLMNKMGFKFKDKERGRLSKNEIWWDPNDPEVLAIRKVESGADIGGEGRKQKAREAGYLPEGTLEVNRTMPKDPRPELEGVWPKLTDEQKSKVTRALMNGATTDEIKTALGLEGIK